MAIIKAIPSDSYDFGEPAMQLVKVASDGLYGNDLRAFIKRAGHSFADVVKRADLKPGDVPVHIIALGAGEFFSGNRNGDFFKEAVLKQYHPTFVKHAHAYRNHDNKNPEKSYGHVKHSAFNDEMKRVELLTVLNGTKEAATRNGGLLADEELEALHKKGEFPTSMACASNPNLPILTRDRNYVPISEIKIGDYVLTHKGRWRKVIQLNRRRYTGVLITFRVNGSPLPLEITEDHLMWAKAFKGSRNDFAVRWKARKYITNLEKFNEEPPGWLAAEELDIGDRLFYKPVPYYDGYGKIDCEDLAAVMGYYLAEGSFAYSNYRSYATSFSCHISDSLPHRIPILIKKLYPSTKVSILKDSDSEVSLNVIVYCSDLAEFLKTHVGRRCENKFIAQEIFNSDQKVKLSFLGAWLDGDGWCDSKGVHWSTSNVNLALQGRDLLVSLGVTASIYAIDHSKCETSGYENSGIEYTLNLSYAHTNLLSKYSQKVKEYVVPTTKARDATLRPCPDGTYAMRICRLSKRKVKNVKTYNFEVEEDESYTAAGLISHNCKVSHDVCGACGNKAKTRAEYCTGVDEGGFCKRGGVKNRMCFVHDDGYINHVDNPDPTFFDISKVYRGADRTSWANGIFKAASEQRIMGGAELAEQYGLELPPQFIGDQIIWPTRIQKLAIKLAQLEQQYERSTSEPYDLALSPGFITNHDWTIKEASLNQTLAALLLNKISLPITNFLELTKQADNTFAARYLPGVFTKLLSSGIDDNQLKSFTPCGSVNHQTMKWAYDLNDDYSIGREYLENRVKRAYLYGLSQPSLRQPPAIKIAGSAETVARQYGLYKLAFLAALQTTDTDFDLTCKIAVRQNYLE
jgi:hypothetical protein